MSALGPRFERFVQERALVRAGDNVLVAVSGGVDSMVLLHLLQRAATRIGSSLRAAHFDHAMRDDSAATAAWLAEVCESWGIPLHHERAHGALHGETAAREARYRFLMRVARAAGSTRIATAHHADDVVETVIFRLLRGTGLRGLAGIPLRRGALVRPLLPFTKTELLAYAALHDVPFREDPTNREANYARNRIRHVVLPALESVVPDARAKIRALARHAARTEAAWRAAVGRLENEVVVSRENEGFELARPVLLEYHPELRARVMRYLLRRFGVVPTRAQTRRLVGFVARAPSGARFEAGRGIVVERAFERIRIRKSRAQDSTGAAVALAGPAGTAQLQLGGRLYDVAWNVGEPRAGAEIFDAGLLEGGLELRGWRAGDRIQMPYGTKKLKKLFAEHRVPASERTRLPVLSDTLGRVVWVVGVARSIAALPGDAGRTLNITVTDAEPS